MTVVVFLGPSLPVAEAREVLDATYLAPAGQGDVIQAVLDHAPEAIGLVDGVFLQTLAVWHKEILFAIDRGTRMYGASSMGALRAAETAAYGMRGVGEVYRMYAEDGLLDDDEVALAHTAAEDGFHALSEPMVNVRATLAAAHATGTIDRTERDRVVAAAKAVYFADRTWPRILADAVDGGLSPSARDRLSRFLSTGRVDLKRRDALEMLATIRDEIGGAPPEPTFTFFRSTQFNTLHNRARRVDRGGTPVAVEDIANHAAVHENEFDELSFQALNRTLVGVLADRLGIDANDEEMAAEHIRFRHERDLDTDRALTEWLANNDMSPDELNDLVAQVAVCRRMHRWFVVANWMERTAPIVVDEMRLRGRYPLWADRAAAGERVLRSRPDLDARAPVPMPLEEMWADHEEWTGRRLPVDLADWAEEAGFHDKDNVRAELKRARAVRQGVLGLLARSSTPAAPGTPSLDDR